MGQIYLNGKAIDMLPPEALQIMSERLGDVISLYFSAHSDAYARFLEGRGAREKDMMKETEDDGDAPQ